MRLTRTLPLLAALTLAACGGQGIDQPRLQPPTPVSSAPVSAPPTAATPSPTAAPAATGEAAALQRSLEGLSAPLPTTDLTSQIQSLDTLK